MEIFGGFMVMMSIIGFFLAVVWLIMPFVVFAIKGKQDRTLDVLETIEKRLTIIESRLQSVEPNQTSADSAGSVEPPAAPSDSLPITNEILPPESVVDKNDSEASLAV